MEASWEKFKVSQLFSRLVKPNLLSFMTFRSLYLSMFLKTDFPTFTGALSGSTYAVIIFRVSKIWCFQPTFISVRRKSPISTTMAMVGSTQFTWKQWFHWIFKQSETLLHFYWTIYFTRCISSTYRILASCWYWDSFWYHCHKSLRHARDKNLQCRKQNWII